MEDVKEQVIHLLRGICDSATYGNLHGDEARYSCQTISKLAHEARRLLGDADE